MTTKSIERQVELQEKLLKIYKEVFRSQDISLDDTLFSLGGDSLTAARLASRIEAETGHKCHVGFLSKYPSIRILAKKLEETGDVEVTGKKLFDAEAIGLIPLLPTQEELLFLHEADPTGRVHNILTRFYIQGRIEPNRLIDSLNRLIESQPALYTRFIREGDNWWQEEIPGYHCELPFMSLIGKEERARQRIIQDTVWELGSIRFIPEIGPMHAGSLLQLDEDRFLFIWNVHHLVFDGWSMSIFLRDLDQLFCNHNELPKANYRGWIIENFERFELISASDIEQRVNQLSEFLQTLKLPTLIKPSMNTGVADGKRFWFTIDKTLSDKVATLARKHETTLFNILYTIYGTLLSLYSGRHSFLIGTPYANRHTPLADKVFGNGIIVIPLGFRLDVSGTILDQIKMNQQFVEDGFETSYISTGRIMKKLNKRNHDPEVSYLQAMFILQNWDHHSSEQSEVKVSQTDIGNDTAKMLITMNMEEVEDGFECWIEFHPGQWDKIAVQRFAEDYVVLLEQAIQHPEKSILKLRLDLFKDHPIPHSGPVAAFIGETTLSLACMQKWQQQGGSIAVAMSDVVETQTWVRRNGIPLLPYERDSLKKLFFYGFDYLFSVVNGFVLKKPLLDYPRIGAINYHDSLLPAFAGVHATSWAIMSGADQHGISWHFMQEQTDRGDYIFQQEVLLDSGIKVSELNSSCYEAGLTTFEGLIDAIKHGRPEAHIQPGQLDYYGLHKKPANGGVIDFTKNGMEIERLYRALAFSAYFPNDLCSIKVDAGTELLYPDFLEYIPEVTKYAPGSVLDHDPSNIRVACADGVILLKNLKDSYGQIKDNNQVIDQLSYIKGRPGFLSSRSEMAWSWLELLSKKEQSWVKFWSMQNDREIVASIPASSPTEEIKIHIFQMEREDLAVAVVLFLSLINKDFTFGIYARDEVFDDFARMVTEPVIPIRVGMLNPSDYVDLYNDLEFQIKNASLKDGFARDLAIRYPSVRSSGRFPPFYDWVLRFQPGALVPGEILVQEQTLTFCMATTGANNIPVENWKERFFDFTAFFRPDKRSGFLPSDALLFKEESAEIDPAIVWAYRDFPNWFLETTKAFKDRPAIRHEENIITYAALESQVKKLASGIRQKAYRSQHIAVAIERSPQAIITQLAIYYLGYTYIPIDPDYPEARIRYILEKSQPALLIVDHETQAEFLSVAQCLVTSYDELLGFPAAAKPDHDCENTIAYLLFTSGSTGEPKGVPITYGALSRFIQDSIFRYNLGFEDVGLQFASLAFDASMEEIFPILLSGGTLVLRTEDWLGSVVEFIRKITDYGITFLDLPTAYWQILVREMDRKDLRFPEPVKQVIIGGDYAQPSTFVLWKKRYPDFPKLVNTYGPTEATVVCVAWDKTDTPDGGENLPIGLPINSLKARLVMRNGMDAPPGIAGELQMSGPTLSPGYYLNDTLTQQKWVLSKGETWYRTGDWVRRTSQGVLYFIGRVDDQIKVGGYLVDLNEVLRVLSELEGVREAAVRAVTLPDKSKMVVGYVETVDGNFDEAFLKELMARSLPPYLIPSRILGVDSIPLNQNNKVDFNKLPLPTHVEGPVDGMVKKEVSDPLEKRIQELWQEKMRISYLDPDADFFTLGLNSLSAVSLLSDLESFWGNPIPLAILLQYPTVRSLASGLREEQDKVLFRPLVKIKIGGTKRPLFIIHGAGLNVLLFNSLRDLLDPQQPVYGIQAKGMDGHSPILTKIEDIISSYMAEIRMAQPQGPYALAGFSIGGMIAFELARHFQQEGEIVHFLGVFDTYAESAHSDWSKRSRLIYKLIWRANQIWYNLYLILRDPKDVIPKKWRWFKYKLKRKLQGGVTVPGEDLQNLPDKLFHIANATINAVYSLDLKPFDGVVHVFRAARRNFYVPDRKYLGWKPFALRGVKVIEIPGDHSEIFAAPQDKEFTHALQIALDESYEVYQQEKKNTE